MSDFRLHKWQAEGLLLAATDRMPPLCIRTLEIIVELCERGQQLEAENADLKNQLRNALERC